MEAGRPVIRLEGRLVDGRTFLVRATREVPRFWVRSADAARARELGAAPLAPATTTTLRGDPVVRVEATSPSDVARLRRRLGDAGIRCFEADVRFAMRYLIDRGVRGGMTIRGTPRAGKGVDLVFDDPIVTPGDAAPDLRLLSLDIETDPRAERIFSVALFGKGVAEVLLVTGPGQDCPAGALPMADEKELLLTFARRVREIDPDILTGWSVIDFDLAVMQRRARAVGAPFVLGRGAGELRLIALDSNRQASRAEIPGRVVLDGLQLLRTSFVPMERHGLDYVARQVLGEGKTIVGAHQVDEIERQFREDRTRFVAYNLTDARLVVEILDRLELIPLAMERSRLTGMPLDRVSASVASFDFLYLGELGRRGLVAPSVDDSNRETRAASGGHVLEPSPGLWDDVLVFDFRSLYPSVIRTFQIDPAGLLDDAHADPDPIVAPNGVAFRRQDGILTGILDELFPRREEAKRRGQRIASQAIKILMNSFYGVLGAAGCRFADVRLADSVTSFGRELLLWTKARSEALGYTVLYGDTDSLFVTAGTDRPGDARAEGERLVARLNADLAVHVRDKWRVESRLVLELEKVYRRLVLPTMRGSTAGARKRYVGLIDDGGESRVEFIGMEVVRRDWTDLARSVQRELYERLFSDRPVDAYLVAIIADLRAGRLDDRLVYRKGLRKSPDAYTTTTPPHVAAARKMTGDPGSVVAYVMTTDGPEPEGERRHPLDYRHYLEKQLRPVAEPVLALLGLDFDDLSGGERQLTLF